MSYLQLAENFIQFGAAQIAAGTAKEIPIITEPANYDLRKLATTHSSSFTDYHALIFRSRIDPKKRVLVIEPALGDIYLPYNYNEFVRVGVRGTSGFSDPGVSISISSGETRSTVVTRPIHHPVTKRSYALFPEGLRGGGGAILISKGARTMALDPTGSVLGLAYPDRSLLRILDAANLKELASVALPDKSPFTFALAHNRITYRVPQSTGAALAVYSSTGGPPLQSVPVPATGLSWCPPTFDPAGDRLWIRARRVESSASAPRSRLLAFPILTDGRLGEPVVSIETEGPGETHATTAEPVVFSTDQAYLGADRVVYKLDASRHPTPIVKLPDDVIGLNDNGTVCITRMAVVHVPSGSPLSSNSFRADAFSYFSDRYVGFAGDGVTGSDNGFYFPSLPPDALGLLKPGRHFLFPTDTLTWPAVVGRQKYEAKLYHKSVSNPAPNELFFGYLEKPAIAFDAPLAVGDKLSWSITHLQLDYDYYHTNLVFNGTAEVFDVHPGPAKYTIRHEPGSRVVEKIVLPLQTLGADLAWTLRSSAPWPDLETDHGVGSSDVTVTLDFATKPADLRSFQLFIGSASGEVVVDVDLVESDLFLGKLLAPDSVDHAFALHDIILDTGEARSVLLQIDPVDGFITKRVILPFATNLLAYHRKDKRLIIAGDPMKIIGTQFGGSAPIRVPLLAYDPETLVNTGSAKAAIDLLNTNQDLSGLRFELVPAEAGKIVLQPYQNSASPAWKIDLSSGQSLLIQSWKNGVGVADPDGNAYYHADLSTIPAVLRKYALDQPGTSPLAAATQPESAFRDPSILRYLPATGIVEWCGRTFDRDLRPLGSLPDEFRVGGGGEPFAVARSLAYDLTAPDAPRSLGATPFLVAYNATHDRFILGRINGFASHSWMNLPLAPIPTATVNPTDYGFTLIPSFSTSNTDFLEIQVRLPGELSWREVQHSNRPWIGPGFIVGDLPDDTPHEVRFRGHHTTTSTPWSDPIPFRTALARPGFRNDAPDKILTPWSSKITAPIGLVGSRLQVDLINAPDGITFDSASRSLIGLDLAPGTYRFDVKVTNELGSASLSITLSVIPPLLGEASSRYAGLLTLDSGPLTGRWNITRSGDRITGTYRTPLFTRSFSASFPPLAPEQGPYATRGATTKISYDGVTIRLTVEWDRVADRMSLSGNTTGLVDDISFLTDESTGFASHWVAKSRPYPKAARYTALMVPEPNPGAVAPAGSGFLRLDADAGGTAQIVGTTALGQPLTQSVSISDAHDVPFFHFTTSLIVLGGFELKASTAQPAPLVGALVWGTPENPKATSYRNGFEQELLVVGAPLPATGKKLPPLAPLANPENRADLLLSGGGLERLSKPITATLVPGASGFSLAKAGTPGNPNRITLKLDLKTGLVSGSADVRDEKNTKTLRTVPFRGQLVKDPFGNTEDIIGGYFLFPDAKGLLRSGRFELTEPDTEELDAPNP